MVGSTLRCCGSSTHSNPVLNMNHYRVVAASRNTPCLPRRAFACSLRQSVCGNLDRTCCAGGHEVCVPLRPRPQPRVLVIAGMNLFVCTTVQSLYIDKKKLLC